MADKEAIKAQIKADPAFRSELKDRIKNALGMRVPPAQPVSYQFDSYMLPDIEVCVCVSLCVVSCSPFLASCCVHRHG